MSWLLSVVLQLTLGCMYLFKVDSSPDICPGVGFQGHDICTVPCVKQRAGGNLLYSTGSSAQAL